MIGAFSVLVGAKRNKLLHAVPSYFFAVLLGVGFVVPAAPLEPLLAIWVFTRLASIWLVPDELVVLRGVPEAFPP